MVRLYSQSVYNLLQFIRRLRYFLIFNYFRHFTMIPRKTYVANLELCRHYKKIEGDIVECGTWRGGMIAGIAKVFGNTRTYHLFDSFEGLPEVQEIDGLKAKELQQNRGGLFNNCTADYEDAVKAMQKAQVNNVLIYKGWFNETMKDLSIPNGIAILRLDGDWYESTMTCLTNLFPLIKIGGLIIIDDYYTWEGCTKAVHDYLSSQKSACAINAYKGVCYITKVE